MHTAIRSRRLRSSRAHSDLELAKTIGKTLGKEKEKEKEEEEEQF